MIDHHDSPGMNDIDFEACPGASEMNEYCNNPSCERKSLFRTIKLANLILVATSLSLDERY